MSPRSHLPHLAPLALLIVGLAASCGGGKSGTSTDQPPIQDTSAPFTQASPGGGLYPAGQLVTLESNESATIYYTLDGFQPEVGGVTTLSGASPVFVQVTHPLSLKFFGIDAQGNVEVTHSEDYSFDTHPPIVLLGGGLPSSLGFLERGTVTFSVDESESAQVSYTAELGGTSTPGTGTVIATGVTTPATPTQFEVPGWKLPIGGSTTLHLFVFDAAGGMGQQPILLSGLADEILPLAGESGELAITSDSEYLYITRPLEDRVLKYGARPGTPNYHQQLASIDVGAAPNGLQITPDDTRVYVSCAGAFYELDVANDSVLGPIATPGGVNPSGAAIRNDGLQLFFAADDGLLRRMNTDLSSPGLYTYNSLVPSEPSMTSADIALSPDGTRGVLSWSGGGQYGAYYFDTDAAALGWMAFLVSPTAQPANVANVAMSQDGQKAWLGEGVGRLARAQLAEDASFVQNFSQSVEAAGITPAPDESVLMLTGGGLVGIRIADPLTLDLLGFVPSGSGIGGGTGRYVALSPDGKRAYVVRNQGSASAELQVLTIQS